MKRIIQEDTWSCLACCAAMSVGKDLKDVYKFLGHDGSGIDQESLHPEKRQSFNWIEIARYLAHNGYLLGSWALLNGCNLTGIDEIHFTLKIKECQAILQVPSERLGGECMHAIYWDGFKIYDPSPGAKENPELADYKVFQFIPVIKL